jgi:hypothetical protein
MGYNAAIDIERKVRGGRKNVIRIFRCYGGYMPAAFSWLLFFRRVVRFHILVMHKIASVPVLLYRRNIALLHDHPYTFGDHVLQDRRRYAGSGYLNNKAYITVFHV